MAAFLNKPSDFINKHAEKEEPLKLIPPSEFEKPKITLPESGTKPTDNKDKDETLTLKLENQLLRLENTHQILKFPRDKLQEYSMTDFRKDQSNLTHSRSLPTDERRYADELISRQAEELTKLRCQVQGLEEESKRAAELCQRQLAETKQEREESVAALRNTLEEQEEEHKHEILRLTREQEGVVSDLQSRLQHMSSDLEFSKGQWASQLNELTDELRLVKKEAREREDSLQQSIREKDSVLQDQAEQIQRLRSYVTENEQKHNPQQVWVQQCETLTNKLKVAEAEKETLESSVQLLGVRLNSIKEILNTQESELTKGKEDTIDKGKLKELLLTRWRQKVYALLVQQKSAQIVNKKDLHNWKEKTEALEGKLLSADNTISILQHTVAEKQAELQLAVNTCRKLQDEVEQAQHVALCLDTRISQDHQAVEHLAEVAHSCETSFEQQTSVLQQALGQLKSLGQRVSFASSRMDILRSQIARNTALKQLEENPRDTAQPDAESEESWRREKDGLVQELSRVRGERDILAAQLQQDSQTWADKLSSTRSQYGAEVSSLKRTVEDLELANQDKAKSLEQVREELQVRQSELSEMKEHVEHLSIELARHQHTMDQALEEQRRQVERQFTDELADMERKVNDARREHTKAVVTLRQQERQWGRERERSEEVQASTVAHYTTQLDHLHQDLLAMERERNICMATLRQEGLLGKVRAERGEPMKLDLQEEVEMEGESQDSQTATEVTRTDSFRTLQDSSEPVSAVLEDLKSLVPAILDDSLDSSDENQE